MASPCWGHPGQLRGPGPPDVAWGDAPTLAREAFRRITSQRNRSPRPGAISTESVRPNGNLHPPLSDILQRTSCAARAARTGGRAPGLTARKSGISVYCLRPSPPVSPVLSAGETGRPLLKLPVAFGVLRTRGGLIATTGRPRVFITGASFASNEGGPRGVPGVPAVANSSTRVKVRRTSRVIVTSAPFGALQRYREGRCVVCRGGRLQSVVGAPTDTLYENPASKGHLLRLTQRVIDAAPNLYSPNRG